MNKKDKATMHFRNHFNCSQSVFSVFGTEFGLSENECMKIACGFGGGIGRQQMICGALTGAVMALGMRYGKSLDDPEEKKSETYCKTRELFAEFTKLNGSTVCRELLNGLDMTNPDEHKKIEELKLFENSCEKYIVDSVKITENLMKKQ